MNATQKAQQERRNAILADRRAKQRRSVVAATQEALSNGYILNICPVSGIQFHTICEAAVGLSVVFPTVAPWATVPAATRILEHTSLSKLSNKMLAGLILVLAGPQHLSLLELQDMSAIEANATLASVEHAELCSFLRTIQKMNKGHASLVGARFALPALAADGLTNARFKEWTSIIRSKLPHDIIAALVNRDASIKILSKEERNAVALARATAKNPALAKYEVEWSKSSTLAEAEAEFKEARAEARTLWADIKSMAEGTGYPVINPRLAEVMRDTLRGRQLNAIPPELRAKLVTAITKLNCTGSQKLARILKDAVNPYDPLATDAGTLFDEVELAPKAPKRSLAEIIAEKKARMQAATQSQAPAKAEDSSSSDAASNPSDSEGDF